MKPTDTQNFHRLFNEMLTTPFLPTSLGLRGSEYGRRAWDDEERLEFEYLNATETEMTAVRRGKRLTTKTKPVDNCEELVMQYSSPTAVSSLHSCVKSKHDANIIDGNVFNTLLATY